MTKPQLIFLVLASFGIAMESCGGQSGPLSALKTAKDYFADPKQAKLAEAAAQGDASEIASLIKQGTDVNAVGRYGMRPLFWAVKGKSIKGFEALLQNGAKTDVILERLPGGDRPPSLMELIAEAASPEYLRLALKYGGDPNTSTGPDGGTIIYQAIMMEKTENIRTLIASKADLNHQNAEKAPPLPPPG